MVGPNKMPRWQLTTASVFLVAIALSIPSGCSKEEMKKMATTMQETGQDLAVSAQEYTQAAVKKVEEQLPESGSVSLRSTPSVEISSAQIELIVIGDGRPNVIQIKTYDDEDGPKKHPSLLAHGATQIDDITKLSGETIGCDLYIQATASGPVAMTPPGDSVQITFGAFDQNSNTINASIGSTRMISSDNKSSMLNGGNVVAKVQGAN